VIRWPGILVFMTAMVATLSGLQTQPGLPLPPSTQGGQGSECLHGPDESELHYRRRVEAYDAMQLIDHLLGAGLSGPGQRRPVVPAWEDLAGSGLLPFLRGMGGPLGDLARKIRWGEREPLPGWTVDYVVSAKGVLYSLTDMFDPCRFKYSSDDPQVLPPRRPGIRPLPLDTDN
jgi:hypothetical protein